MAVDILYVGHSSFQITTDRGTKLLTDPLISGNPNGKMRVADVPRSDVVIVSHNSWDHLGDAFEIAERDQALVVCGRDVGILARHAGIPKERVRSLPWGGRTRFADVEIHAVEAHHHSIGEIDGGWLTGVPLSLFIYTDGGERIDFLGDTSIFSDLKLFGQLYKPNLAMIGIGAAPGGPIEMTPWEAAVATAWLGVKVAIPMHYVDPAEPQAFADALKTEAPGVEAALMESGETRRFKLT